MAGPFLPETWGSSPCSPLPWAPRLGDSWPHLCSSRGAELLSAPTALSQSRPGALSALLSFCQSRMVTGAHGEVEGLSSNSVV